MPRLCRRPRTEVRTPDKVKRLLNENLSPRLVASISDLYPGSTHIEDCGLLAAPDEHVWRFALDHALAIVTKDSDFSERSVLEGCPPKVIWLRIGNCNTARARVVLPSSASEIAAFLSNKQDCCLVISTPMP
jgi:predicted nuclease of predicted toxin-antitoxin system